MKEATNNNTDNEEERAKQKQNKETQLTNLGKQTQIGHHLPKSIRKRRDLVALIMRKHDQDDKSREIKTQINRNV